MVKRILIVDDSSLMRNRIKGLLKTEGHDIVGDAKNGREGIELYKTLRPDLVTMDITMREMGGIEAAKEIMNYDNNAKIIFLSNLDQEKYSKDIEQIGACGYVSKHQTREILDLIDRL